MTEPNRHQPLSLSGRTILVTGASSGIGQATAMILSQLGARLICVGRDRARLDDTASKLAGAGHQLAAFDLSKTEGIPEWLQGLAKSYGPLQGLVHAAGIQLTAPIQTITSDKFQALFSINLQAAIWLSMAFSKRKVVGDAGGSIVFLSSIAATAGSAGASLYAASKGALEAFSKSLALELASRRIRVNCVAPAFVRTPMYEQMVRLWSDEQRKNFENSHPLGLGKPEDVAYAIAFLLADISRWITGTTLVVDGGFTAH